MTKTQRAHLEQRLLEERERILRLLGRHEERMKASELEQDGELTAYPFHMADQGTDTMQQELDMSLASRESRDLEEINEALRRLYEEPERYGRCEVEDEEIAFERLDVIPWARTCDVHASARG